ncbi:MAG TPA: hypothetical protein VFF79_01565 [Conexibacter sp.]|jgi:hypothetical protein|nr:hypothetical protein [Conexibacter sp.]
MYARVAKWEGGTAEALRQSAKQINADVDAGPPEGLPAKGLLMLIDPDGGRAIAISLFETEEDLRQGDATLNTMSPRTDMGRRAAVETYEVAFDVRL